MISFLGSQCLVPPRLRGKSEPTSNLIALRSLAVTIGLVVMFLPIALDIHSLYWEADHNVQLSDKEWDHMLCQNSTS
jgi:hypothetical protein